MPTPPLHLPCLRRTVDNPEFYGEMRKERCVSQPPEVHRRALSDIFKKFHPLVRITTARPSLTIFSPSLWADIMLTSAPPTFRYFESRWSLFALFFTFSLSPRSPLVNAYETRSRTSRDETPSTCQNVTNPPLPREHGREWGLPKRNEISSFSAWVIVLETDSDR